MAKGKKSDEKIQKILLATAIIELLTGLITLAVAILTLLGE